MVQGVARVSRTRHHRAPRFIGYNDTSRRNATERALQSDEVDGVEEWRNPCDPVAPAEGPAAPSLQVWQHATGAIFFSELGAGEEHRLEVKVEDRQLLIEWQTGEGTFEQSVELPFLPESKAVRVELGERAAFMANWRAARWAGGTSRISVSHVAIYITSSGTPSEWSAFGCVTAQ